MILAIALIDRDELEYYDFENVIDEFGDDKPIHDYEGLAEYLAVRTYVVLQELYNVYENEDGKVFRFTRGPKVMVQVDRIEKVIIRGIKTGI